MIYGFFVVVAVVIIWIWFHIWDLRDKVKTLDERLDDLTQVVKDFKDNVADWQEFDDNYFDNLHEDIKIIRKYVGLNVDEEKPKFLS